MNKYFDLFPGQRIILPYVEGAVQVGNQVCFDAVIQNGERVAVPVSRLYVEESIERNPNEFKLKRCLDELESGKWRDYWLPLVVRGPKDLGQVRVIEGNHRVLAIRKQGNLFGVSLPCVFV